MIQIGPVVIEIQGVENSALVVPVSNIIVCRMSILAADTRQCVLMWSVHYKFHCFLVYCLVTKLFYAEILSLRPESCF